MTIPVVYLNDDGDFTYTTCKHRTSYYYQIPVCNPVTVGRRSDKSNTSLAVKTISCKMEEVHISGLFFDIYVDDRIGKSVVNIVKISQMPEIVQYIHTLSSSPPTNKVSTAATQTLTNKTLPTQNKIDGFSPTEIYIDEYQHLHMDITKEKECECGKEKHGFANHSDWCPMFEDKEV